MRQPGVAHVASGRVGQFPLLEMKPRLRKTVEIADMVVMQMGEDDVFNFIRVDAEGGQPLDRIAQEGALAPRRYLGVETGIDDEGAPAALRHPDEIIHRHWSVMRIAADEMIAAPRLTGGVTDRKQLVIGRGHAGSPP